MWFSIEMEADGEPLAVTREPIWGIELPNRHPPAGGTRGATKPAPRIDASILPAGWGVAGGGLTLRAMPSDGRTLAPETTVTATFGIVDEAASRWAKALADAGVSATEIEPMYLDDVLVGLLEIPADVTGLERIRMQTPVEQFFANTSPAQWEEHRDLLDGNLPHRLSALEIATREQPAVVSWQTPADSQARVAIYLPPFTLWVFA